MTEEKKERLFAKLSRWWNQRGHKESNCALTSGSYSFSTRTGRQNLFCHVFGRRVQRLSVQILRRNAAEGRRRIPKKQLPLREQLFNATFELSDNHLTFLRMSRFAEATKFSMAFWQIGRKVSSSRTNDTLLRW